MFNPTSFFVLEGSHEGSWQACGQNSLLIKHTISVSEAVQTPSLNVNIF